ncbi:mediator complex, subunit Med10 [Hypoxylon sp. NC1633]|nr:mediator complex, subunit Med10 [Hypoxylon sp. NC1633]
MAPMSRVDHDALEQQLKDTIQTLTNVMVQVTNYDTTSGTPTGNNVSNTNTTNSSSNTNGRSSRDVIAQELRTLSANLQAIQARASASLQPQPQQQPQPGVEGVGVGVGGQLPQIPPELVQYVDNGRNPDIYTREFVELVRRGNQLMRGKQRAFASFRDVLAAEMDKALPELRGDTREVVEGTTRR